MTSTVALLLSAAPLRAQICPDPLRYCVSAPNSVDLTGAIFGHQGSTSVAANDLTLLAIHLPLDESGVFFYGPERADLPFGDGFRCVGRTAYRLGFVGTGFGLASYDLDLTNPPWPAPLIEPGSTWCFQYWYTDAGGPGGTGFNASDALAITFCD